MSADLLIDNRTGRYLNCDKELINFQTKNIIT